MADLIKKIKIKKQDGTFTDYIPIGAEAKNVDTTDGDSVQLKLNKKPYYYNTVADMKADAKLKVGDMAITLGYYEANDGGGAEYRILTGNYTDDGGKYHQLNNNLFAEIIIRNEINIKQFGAYGDGIHNDTVYITNAILAYNRIFIPAGTYLIDESIDIPAGYHITGEKDSTILYTGDTYCFCVLGSFSTLEQLWITTEKDINATKVGVMINGNKQVSPEPSVSRQVTLKNLYIQNFNKGISLDRTWNITILNCSIAGAGRTSGENNNCGIVYENSAGDWTNSGDIIQNCYIAACYYGLYLSRSRNVTCIDLIIESCNYSVYNTSGTFQTFFINPYFEDNLQAPLLNAPIWLLGGRLDFDRSLNNLYNLSNDTEQVTRYTQKILDVTPLNTLTLSGMQSQVTSVDNPKKTVSLKSFTNYYNVARNNTVLDENCTGEFALVSKGNSSGVNGRSWTNLEFKGGRIDGYTEDIPLRTVFEVDFNGNISNPNGNENANIGTASSLYQYGYFKNVYIKGDNGSLYKLSVDSSGNVKATLSS